MKKLRSNTNNSGLFSPIPRSKFIRNAAMAVGGLMGHRLMAVLPETTTTLSSKPKYSEGGLITETVYYQGVNGYMECLMSRPDIDKKLPGLMIIHEDRGLNNHGRDLAKRAAMEGFCVIAPDALSTVGGTMEELNENKHALKKLDEQENLENFRRGLRYLKGLDYTNEKIGVMGFCWGAGVVNKLIVKARNLNAAVAYYGPQAAFEDIKHINVPLFLHYAELDDNINKGIAPFLIEMITRDKEFDVRMHKGVDHYFNNPLYEKEYDKRTAKKAWKSSFDFLHEKLS